MILSYVFSIAALIISIISLKSSLKTNGLQNRVNELEYQLKQIELAKEIAAQVKEACIEARIVEEAANRHYIKIWNSGTAIAKDINISVPDNVSLPIMQGGKLPYPYLEPNKSFDLYVGWNWSTQSVFELTTIWNDEDGKEHSKKQIISN